MLREIITEWVDENSEDLREVDGIRFWQCTISDADIISLEGLIKEVLRE